MSFWYLKGTHIVLKNKTLPEQIGFKGGEGAGELYSKIIIFQYFITYYSLKQGGDIYDIVFPQWKSFYSIFFLMVKYSINIRGEVSIAELPYVFKAPSTPFIAAF